MNHDQLVTWLGFGSMALSFLAGAVALVTFGYLLRVWEERRSKR